MPTTETERFGKRTRHADEGLGTNESDPQDSRSQNIPGIECSRPKRTQTRLEPSPLHSCVGDAPLAQLAPSLNQTRRRPYRYRNLSSHAVFSRLTRRARLLPPAHQTPSPPRSCSATVPSPFAKPCRLRSSNTTRPYYAATIFILRSAYSDHISVGFLPTPRLPHSTHFKFPWIPTRRLASAPRPPPPPLLSRPLCTCTAQQRRLRPITARFQSKTLRSLCAPRPRPPPPPPPWRAVNVARRRQCRPRVPI